ncbi:glycosyltransferase family 2 protein [Phycicoccus flavus]|uniref:glycosyltransferase family 2 protein n=1 Tax=Phycicoccus flavus TaxID=2502783 RepID=UPI000FEBBD9C|nr:glycosyltransferase family 2 protein [Phycicoccus flavus]NHA67436.1 glycosyltransferase family 2 protein [Phycicoccus flavus]
MTILCDLVLPCRDEAAALPGVLADLPAGLRAVVVDNGSTDGTAEVARGLGATVVHEPTPGYGAAVHAGIEAASAEYVAVLDGDGSMDVREVLPLLEEVRAGRSSMACGRRRPSARGVWPWHARAGNAVVLAWLRHRTGLPVRDIAPMRVCRREDLLALGVRDRRFGYPVEMLVRAQRAGWVLTEHDITYRPRAEGTRSKVSGSVTGTVRAGRDFAKVLATEGLR